MPANGPRWFGYPRRAVRRPLVAFTLAVLGIVGASASSAAAQPTQLLPGVTYETGVQFTPHGPVSLHIVRGPRPVALYRLRPVLSNDSVVLRETLSAMQRRQSTQATSVGVNGDYFSLADGRPSGILLHDGVLATPPNSSRSSAGITLDGLLDVRKVRFLGTWRGTGQRRALNFLNKAPGTNGISLFTTDWGATTPRIQGSVAVVLAPFTVGDPERRSRGSGDGRLPDRSCCDRARHGRPRCTRHGGGETSGRGPARDDGDAQAHSPAGLVDRRRRDRRRPGAGSGRCARVPVERGVYDLPARPSRPAERGRSACGRRCAPRHHRRASARVLGRDDELRARADAPAPRSRARDGARRRRFVDARVRGDGAELTVRGQGACDIDRSHAAVLRRVLAAAARGGRLSERRRRCRGTGSRVQGGPSLDCHGDARRARRGGRGAGVRRARARDRTTSHSRLFRHRRLHRPRASLHRSRPRLCLPPRAAGRSRSPRSTTRGCARRRRDASPSTRRSAS